MTCVGAARDDDLAVGGECCTLQHGEAASMGWCNVIRARNGATQGALNQVAKAMFSRMRRR
jgi:hypothetical protein